MPSTKDPATLVQPGPGQLPPGTVSASSLTFAVPSSDALDAHLTDPIGAHPATAVSSQAINGETWDFPTNVQGALDKTNQGLNARAFWVLDAAGNSDADFSGPTALNAAVAAFAASSRKPALYLRAGTYSWTHPGNNALNNVRILGAPGLVTINGGGSNLVVGLSTVLENVAVSGTTAFVLFGGDATLRNVTISTTSLGNLSNDNTFEMVTVTATGALTLSGHNFSCSGHTVLTCSGAISQSGNGASITGGAWQGSTITVSGSNNTFLGVPFTGTTSLGGSNNIYLSNSGTSTTGTLQVNGVLSVQNDVLVGSDGSGNLAVNGTIGSIGNVTVGADGSGDLTVNGTINATGNVTVGSDGSGNLTVNGNVAVEGIVSTAGDVVIGHDGLANLEVHGQTITYGNVTVGVDGSGNLQVNGTLGAAGDTTVGTDGAGNLQVNGTIGSLGDATIGTDGSGVLQVNGTITALDTIATSHAFVSGEASSGNALFTTTKTAHDHHSQNRWKLIQDWPLSDGVRVRWFSGEGTFGGSNDSAWCVTSNAWWNPAPGGSGGALWSKDNTGKESNILRHEYGKLHWYGRQPGAGTWPDDQWDDQGRGNFSMGDTFYSKAIAIANGASSIGGTLTVTGLTTLQNNLDVNGNSDVLGGDFRVLNGYHIKASGNYQYNTTLTRTVTLHIGNSANNVFLPGDGQTAIFSPGESLVIPVPVPHGAKMKNLKIKISALGNATYTAKIYRMHSVNMGDNSFPQMQEVASASAGLTNTGVTTNVTLSYADIIASSLESYNLTLKNEGSSSANLSLYAVQFTFEETILTAVGSH